MATVRERALLLCAMWVSACGTPPPPAQRAPYPAPDPCAVPAGETAGIFGEWIELDGLPALHYTLDERTDARAVYAIDDWSTSRVHWHQVGNDFTLAIAANEGWVQLFDYSHGARWMNFVVEEERHFGGGFGYIFEDGRAFSTLHADAPEGALSNRVFGTGFFDAAQGYDGLEVCRRVTAPFGPHSWLLSRVRIENRTEVTRRLRHFEYWDVNPLYLTEFASLSQRVATAATLLYDVSVRDDGLVAAESHGPLTPESPEGESQWAPPSPGPTLFLFAAGETAVDGYTANAEAFFGGGGRAMPDAVTRGALDQASDTEHPTFVLQTNVELEPGESKTLWYVYGYTYADIPEPPADPAAVEQASLASWREWLPVVEGTPSTAVDRELAWHAYYLRTASFYDAFYDRRSTVQGGVYVYNMGMNANARDAAQHALPMIYLEPELARDTLLTLLETADPDGEIPYAMHGFGRRDALFYDPDDTDLYVLWLATEYLFATREFALLNEVVDYYPPGTESATLWEHLVQAFRHLQENVGFGASGLVHVRRADWNDALWLEVPGDERNDFRANGESVLASAQAAWVLPRLSQLATLVGDEALAEETSDVATSLREAISDLWLGQWFARAVRGNGEVLAPSTLYLENQPWAILAGIASGEQTGTLLDVIDDELRTNSPLGARVRTQGEGSHDPSPWGEGTQGGIWPSINHTLIWAAAPSRPGLAWDEFERGTLWAHTQAYPEVWVGAWSGPDAYNAEASAMPGYTWSQVIFSGHAYPVQNMHVHSQPLLSFLRLAGIGTDESGIQIHPADAARELSFESPSFGLVYGADGVECHLATQGTEIAFDVVLPDGVSIDRVEVTAASAVSVTALDPARLRLELADPVDHEWRFAITAASSP